jgi:histidinol-phosphate/aromatic aminotransferase/cobyric acid decarboxylase-like protein
VLEDWPAFREAVERLVAQRDRLALELAEVRGVRVFPSRANFLLFELLEHDPRRVFEDLHARGVLVRDVTGYPRLSRCLRVTVGSEDENTAFLAALRESLRER